MVAATIWPTHMAVRPRGEGARILCILRRIFTKLAGAFPDAGPVLADIHSKEPNLPPGFALPGLDGWESVRAALSLVGSASGGEEPVDDDAGAEPSSSESDDD